MTMNMGKKTDVPCVNKCIDSHFLNILFYTYTSGRGKKHHKPLKQDVTYTLHSF